MGELRTSAALVAAALVVVLGGCADDAPQGDPEIIQVEPSEESPSEAPGESEPATEEPPAMPAAAKKRSYGGAAEFVRHWVDLFNHAKVTGETGPMDSVSDRRCVSCQGAADGISKIFSEGGSAETEGWKVREVGADGISPLSGPTLSARIQQTREVITFGSGEVERNDPLTFNVIFDLVRTRSGWSMREVEVLE